MGLHKLSRKLIFVVQRIDIFLDIQHFSSIPMEYEKQPMVNLDVQTIVVHIFNAIFDEDIFRKCRPKLNLFYIHLSWK